MPFSLFPSKEVIKQIILCAIVMAFIIAATASWGLDIIDGRLKLTLYEKGGRFNVFVKIGTDKDFYFFNNNDPNTTQLQVSCDEKLYRMGDTADFVQSVERTKNGGEIVWISHLFNVTEEFSFISEESSPLTEGIKIRINITNLSENDHTIGVRYLFDTYLGEFRDAHFMTSSRAKITNEYASSSNPVDSYWISPFFKSGNGDGLLVVTDSAFVTPPKKIVFANWKRLYDTDSEYQHIEGHDFNLLPYSINDSAVAQFYAAQPLQMNKSREIIILLGTSSSYHPWEKPKKTKASAPNATDNPPAPTLVSSPTPAPFIVPIGFISNIIEIIKLICVIIGAIAAILAIARHIAGNKRKKMLKKSRQAKKPEE